MSSSSLPLLSRTSASVPAPPVVPQELISSIISHLNPNDPKDFDTLKLLSTVSRTTYVKSQEMMFRRVVLGWRSSFMIRARECEWRRRGRGSSKRDGLTKAKMENQNKREKEGESNSNCASFWELLQGSEGIGFKLGCVVRELVVEDYDSELGNYRPFDWVRDLDVDVDLEAVGVSGFAVGSPHSVRGSGAGNGWMCESRTLPRVLDALKNLRRVEVRSGNGEVRFEWFPVELREAFGRVVRRGTVREVVLELKGKVAGRGHRVGDGAEDGKEKRRREEGVGELIRVVVGGCESLRTLRVGSLERDDRMVVPSATCKEYVQKQEQEKSQWVVDPLDSTGNSIPRLETLELAGPTMALVARTLLDLQPQLAVDLTSVRVLSLDLRQASLDDEASAVGELWQKTRKTVEEVVLFTSTSSTGGSGEDPFDPSYLLSLPRLKKIRIYVDVLIFRPEMSRLFKSLMRLVDVVDEVEAEVESLEVVLDLKYFMARDIFETERGKWMELDRRLRESAGKGGVGSACSAGSKGTRVEVERKARFNFNGFSPGTGEWARTHVGCGVTTVNEISYEMEICLGV